MAKDNLEIAPGPTQAKDSKQSKVKENKKKPKQWVKADWVARAKEAGIENAENMTVRALKTKLNQMKKDGLLEDKRGGAREGAGAPEALGKSPLVTALKNQHLMEEVEVTIHDRAAGTIRSEKKATMLAILDMLRQEALKQKSVPAAKEYFDRTLGRAKQEIDISGEIKTDEQRMPTPAEIAAARAYEEALSDEDDSEDE